MAVADQCGPPPPRAISLELSDATAGAGAVIAFVSAIFVECHIRIDYEKACWEKANFDKDRQLQRTRYHVPDIGNEREPTGIEASHRGDWEMIRQMRRGIAPLTIVLAAVFTARLAYAEQTNVELIVDDSGSMAQHVTGGRKIDVAKQVLPGLIQNLPADAQIAVRTYGRQHPARERDCADLELMTAFGANTSERILPGVNGLKPNGMTPIAASLQAAAKDFAGKESQNNIIVLLTDGEEDCNGDPCAASKAVHDAGIHLQVNVIGFHVTDKERPQLQCIANAGGGKYYDAANASELKLAASEVEERIVAPAPAPTPQATPNPSGMNLLSPTNGGEVLVAPNDGWRKSNDDSEDRFGEGNTDEVVYGFKDGQAAAFDTFATFVPSADSQNLKDFELLVGNDSPTGDFASIGKFTVTNAKLMKSPYQEFKFAPATGKYFKVKLLSSYGYSFNPTTLYEFKLYGKLAGNLPAATPAPTATPSEINVLAQVNGGEVLVAPNDKWTNVNDGREDPIGLGSADEAVFGFKNGLSATFDSFEALVPGADPQNLKDFELLVGNESPAGSFSSIGKFTVTNAKLMKSPYQEFKFAPVTAKYLKVKLLSSYGYGFNPTTAYEFRLMGKLEPIAAAAAVPTGAPTAASAGINLLATSSGGQLLLAPNDTWNKAIDGREEQWGAGSADEAVFAFKDERPATFDTFEVYVPAADSQNLKDFELLAGDEGPTGKFSSIGKFTVMNAKMMKSPYQAFKFAPVTAKYLKIKLLSSYGYGFNPTTMYEIRLVGHQ